MNRELSLQDLKFLEKIQILQQKSPDSVKNIEYLIDGILIGAKLKGVSEQNGK
ncbi:MAG: hypothetical protein ACRCX8_19475 [Sarcina sp.]